MRRPLRSAVLSLSFALPAAAQSIPRGVHEVEMQPDGRILITDGGTLNNTVPGVCFLVEPDGTLVHSWIQRTLFTHSAQMTEQGRILVTDTNQDRVIELAPDGSITWSSVDVTPLSDGSTFDYPNDATVLASGHFLISDRDRHRILEIDRAGVVHWQYGVTGVPGSGAGFLRAPHSAQRLANGNTLIPDSDNDRVLEVDLAGAIVWTFQPTGTQALDWPRDADEMADGRIAIADSRHNRIVIADRTSGFMSAIAVPTMLYDVDPLADGTFLVGGLTAYRVDASGTVLWQYPIARTVTVQSPVVVNPTSGVTLSTRVCVPSDAGSSNRRPAVVFVPGGSGNGQSYATQCNDLARCGFVACHFDPDGRGLSTNGGTYTLENYDGHVHQDGLRQVVLHLAARADVDPTRIAIATNSYGITMASGMLARYPNDPPVALLRDWEGPASRDETASVNGGHVPVSPSNDAFWSEREAVTFIGDVRCLYLREQSTIDHIAASHPVNFHAIDMFTGALGPLFGGTGRAREARINAHFLNPAYAPFTLADPPRWIAENVQNNPYSGHVLQLELTRAFTLPALAVIGPTTLGATITIELDAGAARAGAEYALALSPRPMLVPRRSPGAVSPALLVARGTLDALGRASATVTLASDPGALGTPQYALGLVTDSGAPLPIVPSEEIAFTIE